MLAKVYVTLKPGLLDAQGKTVKGALDALGFHTVDEVRVGKYIELELHGLSASAAKSAVERMCQQLLTNPIIETYRVDFGAAAKPAPKKTTRARKPAPRRKKAVARRR